MCSGYLMCCHSSASARFFDRFNTHQSKRDAGQDLGATDLLGYILGQSMVATRRGVLRPPVHRLSFTAYNCLRQCLFSSSLPRFRWKSFSSFGRLMRGIRSRYPLELCGTGASSVLVVEPCYTRWALYLHPRLMRERY